ncbi:MAG: RluA family pseudouridine synthase, partial [Bdellovibrionales bacterium]|nr:RluA family pseudouridine synthase [Bdellovibrionales bacterium]
GDNTYGNFSRSKNLKSVKLRTQIKNLNRIALHAAELGFTHPTSKERLLFKTDWPADMVDFIKELK